MTTSGDAGAGMVVGIDNGGTANNTTVLTMDGRFLVDTLLETPSRVREGTTVAVEQLVAAFDGVLRSTGIDRARVQRVGLATPGPASADGIICQAGSTNFGHESWRAFDVRSALENALGIPVTYSNDGNAAAVYAHHTHFGDRAFLTSSLSVIVGTGLGGGFVHHGSVLKGAAGMAGEVGHVLLPIGDVLEDDQPVPVCNCGQRGDAESVASLAAIELNLLPYWLTRHPAHPLSDLDAGKAARQLRSYGERRDPMALAIFGQQAKTLGRLFSVAANLLDPDAYFLGGGVVEATPAFRDWFVDEVRAHTVLRPEQEAVAHFALVTDLDMAGARGAALVALQEAVAP